MVQDIKRFAIARRDLIIAIKTARTLDDLLAVIKRKYIELKGPQAPPPPPSGPTINVITTQTSTQNPMLNQSSQSPNSRMGSYPPPPPPPPPPDMAMYNLPPPPPLPPSESTKFDDPMKSVKCGYCGYVFNVRNEAILFCPNCGNSLE
jgi:hypothetical protein